MVTGALPTRSVKNHIKEKTEMFSSFKDSTFITHIHARNHANKKCIIRDIKENLGLFLQVLITLPNPNTNRPLKNEKFTPRGPLEVRNSCPNTNRPLKNEKFTPKGPLNRAIYVQIQTGHSKMRNLRQVDHLK